MPYIDPVVRAMAERNGPVDAGTLNYLVTKLVRRFIGHKGLSYETLNAAIGVLEAAKIELYRRVVAPYEDDKIEQNGDVYA